MVLRTALLFQIIAFQPFLLSLIDKNPDSQSKYFLTAPMATGFVTLQIGVIIFILNRSNEWNTYKLSKGDLTKKSTECSGQSTRHVDYR